MNLTTEELEEIHAAAIVQKHLTETVLKDRKENETPRKLNADASRLASQEATAKHYAEEQLTHLAKFLGLHGMTWAHVVSEAVSLIERQKNDNARHVSSLKDCAAKLSEARALPEAEVIVIDELKQDRRKLRAAIDKSCEALGNAMPECRGMSIHDLVIEAGARIQQLAEARAENGRQAATIAALGSASEFIKRKGWDLSRFEDGKAYLLFEAQNDTLAAAAKDADQAYAKAKDSVFDDRPWIPGNPSPQGAAGKEITEEPTTMDVVRFMLKMMRSPILFGRGDTKITFPKDAALEALRRDNEALRKDRADSLADWERRLGNEQAAHAETKAELQKWREKMERFEAMSMHSSGPGSSHSDEGSGYVNEGSSSRSSIDPASPHP